MLERWLVFIEPQVGGSFDRKFQQRISVFLFLKKRMKIDKAINTAMRKRAAWRTWAAMINNC